MRKNRSFRIIITLSISILYLLSILGYYYLEKYQEINNVTFINMWVPEALLVLSFTCLLITLYMYARGIIKVTGIIVLTILIVVSLISGGSKLNSYIELESPNRTHKILVFNQLTGFETGISNIYLKHNKIFKRLVGCIIQEKSGGVIGVLNPTLEWISEDILIIRYTYYGEDKKFLVDFRKEVVNEL